jgi:hypothetical protein
MHPRVPITQLCRLPITEYLLYRLTCAAWQDPSICVTPSHLKLECSYCQQRGLWLSRRSRPKQLQSFFLFGCTFTYTQIIHKSWHGSAHVLAKLLDQRVQDLTKAYAHV